MLGDLLDRDIQPKKFNAENIPEIVISENLQKKIEVFLQTAEDGKFAHVFERTAIVRTGDNYVFFPNTWLYLAVLCKKYAEALLPYAEQLNQLQQLDKDDKKGRIDLLKNKTNINDPELIKVIPDLTERERLYAYIEGSDGDFRPGKKQFSAHGLRGIKDIFGSAVLKKLNVPDSSTNYLGNLIYHLARQPELYDEIEKEVIKQIPEYVIELPDTVNGCAEAIVEYVYAIDGFERMSDAFEITDEKIAVEKSNIPPYDLIHATVSTIDNMFFRPASALYDSKDTSGNNYCFEKEYEIQTDNDATRCRLSTEWDGADIVPGVPDGNYLQALIGIINERYSEYLEIKEEDGKYYLYQKKKIFSYKGLPDIFKNRFAKRYILSLLAKPFVILTGNSGTGKTRIAKQFAEYLNVDDEQGEKSWLIMPVGADWTDNSKIMGFYNPLGDGGAGKYEKTAVIKLIERANENPNVPYFLILDEMNLSHVERYFSDFLSHMEIPDSTFEMDGYKNDQYGNGKLQYPDNLFVVGTVNIDETTYMFSPKVLDRANVIEFKPEKDDVMKLFYTVSVSQTKVAPAYSGISESFLLLAQEIRKGKCSIPDKGSPVSMDTVKECFSKVYDKLKIQDFEFAYRTVKEIRQYLSATYELFGEDEKFDIYEPVDEQLLQKVLPKIHGNRKQIGNLLNELEEICKTADKELPLSEEKIKQMKGKLDNVQYASFI